MGAVVPSIVTLIGLVVFNAAPLVFGILAVRSAARDSAKLSTDWVFWGLLGIYLGAIGLIGLALISTVSHPQREGLATVSLTGAFTVVGLPGSVTPFFAGLAVLRGSIARPFGLASMSTWLVIGTLCWQFFLIVGLRWLVRTRSRGPVREISIREAEQPAAVLTEYR